MNETGWNNNADQNLKELGYIFFSLPMFTMSLNPSSCAHHKHEYHQLPWANQSIHDPTSMSMKKIYNHQPQEVSKSMYVNIILSLQGIRCN